jgi:hypothetical protein
MFLIQYGKREATIQRGTEQVLKYADRCGADEIYLVIFDRTKEKSWDDKIFTYTIEEDGKLITIFGM